MTELKAFNTRNHGRNIQFLIGDNVLSIGIGPDHYCENRATKSFSDTDNDDQYSNDCELAVFSNSTGDWKTSLIWAAVFEEDVDDVVANVTFDQFIAVLTYLHSIAKESKYHENTML